MLPFSTVMEIKSEQFRKTSSPMEITLLGISIEVKPVQLLKARSPMEVTLLGIIVV